MPGNWNTTKCEKAGRDGNVKTYCVSEMMIGLVSTGLPGRIRPNGGATDMDDFKPRGQISKDMTGFGVPVELMNRRLLTMSDDERKKKLILHSDWIVRNDVPKRTLIDKHL